MRCAGGSSTLILGFFCTIKISSIDTVYSSNAGIGLVRIFFQDAKTECDALEAFNANLDCAIVTMNDVCEVDAQNLVCLW